MNIESSILWTCQLLSSQTTSIFSAKENKVKLLKTVFEEAQQRTLRYYNIMNNSEKLKRASYWKSFENSQKEQIKIANKFPNQQTPSVLRKSLISTEMPRFTPNMIEIDFFLSAIWLPHGQLWAILRGTASLIWC